MLWPGINYFMYLFQSKSRWIFFVQRRVEAGLYIFSSQMSSIGSNPQAKQNVDIRELNTLYMQWPGIYYPMYSFQSRSHWIIFIPRRVKAWLYIEFKIKFNMNESPIELKSCYTRSQNALYAMSRNKVQYVFNPITVWLDNIYFPTRWSWITYIVHN
jgi:hypothetical protein